ncbi:PEGA domain-containing protein [Haliangium ochraceum]|uniref:Uncharacterized protein n=1 Tax=Haliangium ochraceum (strain DSM 14365 / JCM 11303 / SMP-2) TaxID=502025 RepID=D0LTZ7_HALO1|nr:PEGA domain-containing protein [Haliangium ochraceum]ACY17361.1 hypothetical protein Hoch_4872 [Haliangium ochraceum DSM 14365]
MPPRLSVWAALLVGIASATPVWAQSSSGRSEKAGPAVQVPAPSSASAATVTVIDLRPAGPSEAAAAARSASREAFWEALADQPRLRLLPQEPALRALLGGGEGAAAGLALGELRARLVQADALRRGGECDRARAEVDAALLALAAVQAGSRAGPVETVAERAEEILAALRAGYGIELACADRLAQPGPALLAAERLRALGGELGGVAAGEAAAGSDRGEYGDGLPEPVSGLDEVLARYPAVDVVANTHVVELAIASEPKGAAIWLDHEFIGAAPVRVLSSEGPHLLAAAQDGRVSSQRVLVDRDDVPPAPWGTPAILPVSLTPSAPPPTRWQQEDAALARWRRAGAVDADGLHALMVRLGVRYALVLVPGRGAAGDRAVGDSADGASVQIWARAPGAEGVRRSGTGRMQAPAAVAGRVLLRADAAAGAGAEGPTPLLREGDAAGRFGSPRSGAGVAKRPWWAYATIIGAVTATTLLILAADLGSDRQRIELRWP